MKPITAYAQINARIKPIARGERFETPLEEALAANGLGEVSGGGTLQQKTGEIVYCGIDIDFIDLERGGPFLCQFLTDLGAPKGSKLTYELDGQNVEVPFGATEGLAIYLNGNSLPAEVYKQCDVNVIIEKFESLLADQGSMWDFWEGPTETALYLYGASEQQMRTSISAFMAEYPLCQRARIERIA